MKNAQPISFGKQYSENAISGDIPPGTILDTGDAYLVFIRIPEFVSENLVVDACAYQTRRPISVTGSTFRSPIFCEHELKQINGFKTMKKQIEWMSGRFCVKLILKEKFSVSMESCTLSYEEDGAPFLSHDPGRCISLSHSGEYAGAAVVREMTSVCGLDIEKTSRENMGSFITVAYTEAEQIAAADPRERFVIWTAKEAYLKYLRRGFHEPLKSIEYRNGDLFHRGTRVSARLFTQNIDKEHVFSFLIGKAQNRVCGVSHITQDMGEKDGRSGSV